jgi:hypothetical protein
MRDLWKGLAVVALDVDLREEIRKVAKFDDRPEYEFDENGKEFPAHPKVKALHLRNQPNVDALRKIYQLYRDRKKVYLSAYALAEINRWFVEGGLPFIRALAAFRDGVAYSVGIASRGDAGQPSPEFLEALGVMVVDSEFRDMFGKSEKGLSEFGFVIDPAEEAALRKDFTPSSVADIQSEVIFRLGWSGTTCAGRLLPYPGMFHTNM